MGLCVEYHRNVQISTLKPQSAFINHVNQKVEICASSFDMNILFDEA